MIGTQLTSYVVARQWMAKAVMQQPCTVACKQDIVFVE